MEYIKHLIFLTELTKEDKNFSDGRFDEITRIANLAKLT